MSDKIIQTQINEINNKLDLVIQYVNDQRLKGDMVEDLVQDLSIIGKDAFQSAVIELDRQGVELDPEEIKVLLVKMIKNANNFSQVLNTFESMLDLMKDLGPISHEIIIDLIYKLQAFEQKGYFEFLTTLTKVFDNIVVHYSKEEVELLADNVVTILDTVKNLTQPDMLQAINNAVNIYKDLDPTNVPEITLWKTIRILNSPEMRKGFGFVITFLRSLTSRQRINNHNV
ncbi:MAG: DUF1641 domain-containing protein [Chlorobi bacterium]|nr:DUF1641 domain-containing protein [Chlorobiota bacterium]